MPPKGYGCYGARVHCIVLMQRLPSMPPMLPHVSAVGSDHVAVNHTCRTCVCDTAPQSSSRGRRTATACAAHAPMPPRCADMPPAATAEPHAPRKVIDGRWAHARGLGGMMHMCSPPMSLSPRRVYLPCSSASRDVWPIWTGMWPRVSSAYPGTVF